MTALVKRYRSLLILVVTVLIVASITGGDFFSSRNLTNLTRQVSINGILSVGMTFVILTGGIDLSVGSVVALAGIVGALMQVNYGQYSMGASGALMSMTAAVLSGLLCGGIGGFTIVRTKVVPFIITLGLMVIARGLALIFSKGAAVAPLSDDFNWFGQGYFAAHTSTIVVVVATLWAALRAVFKHKDYSFTVVVSLCGAIFAYAFYGYKGAPVPAVLFALIALTGHYFLQNTVWGRYIVATGSNPQAAYLSGVPVGRIIFSVYAIMGLMSGLSGGILSARLNGAMPTAGDLFELDAIAAVVIGGTKLTGGVGSIGGSVIGAFLIGTINNGMSLLNVDEFYQKVLKGIIIIAAVYIDTKGKGRSST